MRKLLLHQNVFFENRYILLVMFYSGQIRVALRNLKVSLKRPVLIYLFSPNRGGRGGGYKELDEQELEETKRRRREAEEVKYAFFIFSFVAIRMSCEFFGI